MTSVCYVSANVLCPGHIRPQHFVLISGHERQGGPHHAGRLCVRRQAVPSEYYYSSCFAKEPRAKGRSYKATAHPRLPQPLCSWETRVMPSYSKVEMDHTAWLAGPHFDRWAD